MANPYLKTIIFKDGQTATPGDAARMILNYERPGLGDNLSAIAVDENGNEFKTYVFWRTYGSRFAFQSSSGDSLWVTSVKIPEGETK